MSVPDDVRSLTAEGTAYRTVEAPAFDLGDLIGEMEAGREGVFLLAGSSRTAPFTYPEGQVNGDEL